MIERSYYICFHQGRAFTFLTIMNVLKDDPRFRDVTFVYLSPYLADDPEISDIFTQTPTRFKLTPAQADTIERAAGIVVEKARGKILDQLQEEQEGAVGGLTPRSVQDRHVAHPRHQVS